jgi:acyl-coenzyme A synthetase/AMP-(fatty) acid ligase
VDQVNGDAELTAHVVAIDGDLETDWMGSTLRNWCSQELEPLHQPASFVFVGELPRTRLGVVDYRRIEAAVNSEVRSRQ